MSAFPQFRPMAYPYKFRAHLIVDTLVGGIPNDPKVAEGWIASKLGVESDDRLRAQVAETMVERGVDVKTAVTEVNKTRNVNGFKRDENGLYIESRNVKAMLKEATSIATSAQKIESRGWGSTNKGIKAFTAEHIFVVGKKIYIMDADGNHITEPDSDTGRLSPTGMPEGPMQRFVSTHLGTGITYEDYVREAHLTIELEADWDFRDDEFWAAVWLTGERNGLGASRSQGFGQFTIESWEVVSEPPAEVRAKHARKLSPAAAKKAAAAAAVSAE